MHKKFTFGLIALLGVSLFIMGCDDSSDDAGPSNEEKATALAEALGGQGKAHVDQAVKTKVVLDDDVTLPNAITVESGVTLDTGAHDIDVDTYTLTVAGTLNVATGGSITGTGTPPVKTTGTGSVSLADATAFEPALLLSGAGKIEKLTLTAAATLVAAAEVPKGLELTLKDTGSITTASSSKDLTVKGKVTAGGLVIEGGTGDGVVTDTTVGVVIAVDSLTIGAADEIAIGAGGSINLGGVDGINLGVGSYKSAGDETFIKMDADKKPTLTFDGGAAATFTVGVGTGGVGVLTVGKASIIKKTTQADEIDTESTASPAPAGLEFSIAAGATITASSGNDGGITLVDGTIATRSASAPGVSDSAGLQLVGSDDSDTAKWAKGTATGSETP
jgi:hypothetical protein